MSIEFYDDRCNDWQEADDFADLQAWVDDEPAVFEAICNPQKNNWASFLDQLETNNEKKRAEIFRDMFPSSSVARWRLAISVLCANTDILESDGMSLFVSATKCAMEEGPATNPGRQQLASWLDPQCQEVPFAGAKYSSMLVVSDDDDDDDYDCGVDFDSSCSYDSVTNSIMFDTDF